MFKSALELGALILSIINGIWLLLFYLRDKPNIIIKPIHPEIYQWWFELPSRTYNGEKTRRFGFLLYVGLANKGLRKTTVDEWRLKLSLQNFRKSELKPLNIPQPQLKVGTQEKYFNVLGQVSPFSHGMTEVDSGSSVSGMIFYTYECWGSEVWNPRFKDGNQIRAKFRIKEVFGKSTSKAIIMSKKSIEEVENYIPGLLGFLETLKEEA